jgi:tetratricopeptide (TPR) repeat protein
MHMQERVQLARALAEKHGRRLTEVEDWQPLLRFTDGNPLTLTVLVGQALRDGLKTKAQAEAFVARLRAGESAFEDEASEGRSKSLGASLSYGFEQAFSEGETKRKQLGLLYFFQGFLNVDALRFMGRPELAWCVPAVRGLTREAGTVLLDRAAEVGLLTPHGEGYYTIHPALPWFFKRLFEAYYPSGPAQQSTARAFVEAMGDLGCLYVIQYDGGNSEVIAILSAEEANLLHARQLACTHGWWEALIGTMHGLRPLYMHTGRRAEWTGLVNEIVPKFVDPATDGPLVGREEQWRIVAEYRALLARELLDWTRAERLNRACVDWDRSRAAAALSQPPEAWDSEQRSAIQKLSSSLHQLGQVLRESGNAECVAAYKEALSLATRLGARKNASTCASNLGLAYYSLEVLRDLALAERWYQQSLEFLEESDRYMRAGCLLSLGNIARARFLEARRMGRSEREIVRHLKTALDFCHQTMSLLPPGAVYLSARAHDLMGCIRCDLGDIDRGLSHMYEAIRQFEAAGDLYAAALTRRNVAVNLAAAGSLVEAREYAFAALRNYKTFGIRASANIEDAQSLIADIDRKLQVQAS